MSGHGASGIGGNGPAVTSDCAAQTGQLTRHEQEVLRILAGEAVRVWVAGAAIWACAAALKGMGLAEGYYRITQAGRDYLASHEDRR
jgi:hypothetical protein